MISVPNRPSGLGINAPPGSRIMDRNARPLNGIEIADAVKETSKRSGAKLLNENAVGLEKETRERIEKIFAENLENRLSTEWGLQKRHLVYPKAGWRAIVTLEKIEQGKSFSLSAELEIDLDRGQRIAAKVGMTGLGPIVAIDEVEQLHTNVPDQVRHDLGLPVTVDVVTPDGQVVKAEVGKVAQPKFARSIDLKVIPDRGEDILTHVPLLSPPLDVPADELIADIPDNQPLADPIAAPNKPEFKRPNAKVIR